MQKSLPDLQVNSFFICFNRVEPAWLVLREG
jgi:hypothetical protein